MFQPSAGSFGLLEGADCDYGASRAVLLPVPYERTTSYGRGTARGPQAILEASHYLELYDQELGTEPYRMGIATLPYFEPQSHDLAEALAEIRGEALRHLQAGKFLVVLGGEHGLSAAPIAAAREALGELGVVQFDAHADLRDEYEGTPHSHACVMRRVADLRIPALGVGIRSLSAPEAELIEDQSLPVLWGQELEDEDLMERFRECLDALPERLYLTFDVDYFDPSLIPATGTPEPGGGTWYSTLALLRELFTRKTVVAMDLVELAPIPGQPASDFLAAKLLYKCLGYLGAGSISG